MTRKINSLYKKYEHFYNHRPEKITGLELQTLPVFKDKSTWIAAMRRGEFLGFPISKKNNLLPIDFSEGVIGYYKIKNGYMPLFRPECETVFLSSYDELSSLYKNGGHDLFIIPEISASTIKGLANIPDREIKRYVTIFLNSFDVHLYLSKEQVQKVFDKNLFSDNKYFITSSNNHNHSNNYYSKNELELFEEIQMSLYEISSKIAVNYSNYEKQYYLINVDKANTLLSKKIMMKPDNKKFFFIPEIEFSIIKSNKTHLNSSFLDFLKLKKIDVLELYKRADFICLDKKNKGFLFEKNSLLNFLNISFTRNKKKSNHIETRLIKMLNYHPLLTNDDLSIMNVYNTTLRTMYSELSVLKETFPLLPLGEPNLTVSIPRELLENFIKKYKTKLSSIIFIGIDHLSNFHFLLEGEAKCLELELILEFN